MDCQAGRAHHWDLNAESYGVCRHCGVGKQFPRPGQSLWPLGIHRTDGEARPKRGRPAKPKVATPAPKAKDNGRPWGRTGYWGVTINSRGRFQASLVVGRRTIYLGEFGDALAAARAHDQAVLAREGSRARLNKV